MFDFFLYFTWWLILHTYRCNTDKKASSKKRYSNFLHWILSLGGAAVFFGNIKLFFAPHFLRRFFPLPQPCRDCCVK
jgi:hypothetical protein